MPPPSWKEIENLFPDTDESLSFFKENTIIHFTNALVAYKRRALELPSYASVIDGWLSLTSHYYYHFVQLRHYSVISADHKLSMQAHRTYEALCALLLDATSDEDIIFIFLKYCSMQSANDTRETLSPYQHHILNLLLHSLIENSPPNSSVKQHAMSLCKQFAVFKDAPYEYIIDNNTQQVSLHNNAITILSWNVCCFDGGLPLCFGGILPWKMRLKNIAEFIRQQRSDILCLQEVFSDTAAMHLYELLKDTYPHFYLKIGPRPALFYSNTLDIPSGLFVASRAPLIDTQFVPYSGTLSPPERGYGFFQATIQCNDKKSFSLATTHLQPGYTKNDASYRFDQLQFLCKYLATAEAPFICGDLNIERDSAEYRASIEPFFDNHYNGQLWTCCELRDYWWKVAQDVDTFSRLPPALEWLDYFLSVRSKQYSASTIETKSLMVSDLSQPDKALSDHQPILATIKIFPS